MFDDLADLPLLEILTYLSSTDVLCAFTSLNDRWSRLLAERGFFRQVNLSATHSRQFHQLLQILPLNNIETLVIDRTASSLQLIRWPYLPRLTRLHLRGVREYGSVLYFVLIHAATLAHITIESDDYSLSVSERNRSVVTRYRCISFSSCRSRVDYQPNSSIPLILYVHSSKTFYFAICLIFARSIWASIQVITCPAGTWLLFGHLSLVSASQCKVSRI